jgi:hypothetical protein
MGILYDPNAPQQDSEWWNFTKPDAPGYMDELIGTVVDIYTRPATLMGGAPDLWPDGNQKINPIMVIKGQSGRELKFEFKYMRELNDRCKELGITNKQDSDLRAKTLGKKIRLKTGPLHVLPGMTNATRPWEFQIIGPGEWPVKTPEVAQSPTQPQVQASPMQVPQQQPTYPQQAQAVPQQQMPMTQQQPMQQQPAQQVSDYPLANQQQQQQAQPQTFQDYAQALPQQPNVYDQNIPF